MGELTLEDFAPGDRVRVDGFDRPSHTLLVDGEEGSVVMVAGFVQVELDDAALNARVAGVWMFAPNELVKL